MPLEDIQAALVIMMDLYVGVLFLAASRDEGAPATRFTCAILAMFFFFLAGVAAVQA